VLDSLWVCKRVAGGNEAAHRVAQQDHVVDVHFAAPFLHRFHKLLLAHQGILGKQRSRAASESEDVHGVHRPTLGEGIQIHHPQGNARSQAMEQNQRHLLGLCVHADGPDLVGLAHRRTNVYEEAPVGQLHVGQYLLLDGAEHCW